MTHKKGFTLMELLVGGLVAFIMIFTFLAKMGIAQEFQFNKGVAFNFSGPLINSTSNNTFAVGANNTAFYVHGGNAGAVMGAFGAAYNNTTIVGTSGIYNFPLNATETNYDRIGILYNGTGVLQQYFVINTKPKEMIDANNVSVTNVYNDVHTNGVAMNAGNKTGYTVSTVSDKTGYTVSTVSDKTGYSLSVTPPTAAQVRAEMDANSTTLTAINGTVNHATYGNSPLLTAVNTRGTSNLTTTNLGGLTNVTLAATQTGVTIPTVTAVTNNVSVTNCDVLTSTRGTGNLTQANIWQTDISGYSTSGQAGTYLKSAGAAADPWATALPGNYSAGSAGAIIGGFSASSDPWNVALPGAYAAGKAGYILGNNLNASISSRSSHSASDVATLVLATPANKLATDATGRVTVGSNADKTGYTASTVSDKTGYALTQTFPANFSSLAITGAGAVTAGTVGDKTGYTASTVSDKTGYALTQAFPANFSSLLINAAGNVTANPGAGGATAQQVWEYNTTAINTAGLAGTRLNSAGSSGDPWATPLPGSYTGTQAGYLLQNEIKKARGR